MASGAETGSTESPPPPAANTNNDSPSVSELLALSPEDEAANRITAEAKAAQMREAAEAAALKAVKAEARMRRRAEREAKKKKERAAEALRMRKEAIERAKRGEPPDLWDPFPVSRDRAAHRLCHFLVLLERVGPSGETILLCIVHHYYFLNFVWSFQISYDEFLIL